CKWRCSCTRRSRVPVASSFTSLTDDGRGRLNRRGRGKSNQNVDQDPIGHKPEHPPGQSVWPIGFAIGIACVLVGLVISWWVVAIGGAITLVFGALWLSDLAGHPILPAASAEPESAPGPAGARHQAPPETSRTGFLAFATLPLGAP